MMTQIDSLKLRESLTDRDMEGGGVAGEKIPSRSARVGPKKAGGFPGAAREVPAFDGTVVGVALGTPTPPTHRRRRSKSFGHIEVAGCPSFGCSSLANVPARIQPRGERLPCQRWGWRNAGHGGGAEKVREGFLGGEGSRVEI
jgi:hypothetical protein